MTVDDSATQALSHTLMNVLESIHTPQQLSHALIHSVSLLVGGSTLVDALDLIDKQAGTDTQRCTRKSVA